MRVLGGRRGCVGSWVYVKSKNLGEAYVVGFYSQDGEWPEDSKFRTGAEVAERVHYLNGGSGTANNSSLAEFELTETDVADMLKAWRV